MTEFILGHQLIIRLSFFVAILVLMATWEILKPRRVLNISKPYRWTSNLGIVFLNSFILRVIFPAGAVGVALFATDQAWGLFHYFKTPYGLALVLSIVALDFVIYLQHVMFHAVPIFWRLHRMHHADLDFDVTTGARFHPVEIILSMLIKFCVIVVLGAPVLAVIIFEVLLNMTSMFNHSNAFIPLAWDRFIRYIVVTPDMHRVHHSILAHETNSNFGFNLSLWDRLFGTYKNQPDEGHERMTIGIRDFRDPKQASRLDGMLMIPFVGKVTHYAINRRSENPRA
ncbi:MAG: sterol desaturase family protein [Gammaproteobacteria bacterium]|nr:sterol desaturase family protein [Gammaproteobacteria bacterium]